MEQTPNQPNPENLPLYARPDILQQSETDAALAEHLETLRIAATAADLRPENPQTQLQLKNAEELVRGYLESGGARRQHPQG